MDIFPHYYFAEMGITGNNAGNPQSELYFFLDALPVGIVIHSATGITTYLNASARILLGCYTSSPLTLKDFAAATHLYRRNSESLYPTEQLPGMQALQGQQVCVDDLEVRQGDRRVQLQARAIPIRNELGHITHAIVALQDITERSPTEAVLTRYNQVLEHQVQQRTADLEREMLIRQRIEHELRHHQIRLKTLSEAVPGILYSLLIGNNQAMTFEYVNRRIAAIYEAPLANIMQAPHNFWLAQMHPEDRVGFENTLARCTQNLTGFSYEWRNIGPSGQTRWLQTQAQPERRDNNQICWHGLLLDVTQRKQTELELQHQVAQSKAMLTAIPDLILQVNREGYYLGYLRNNPDVNLLPTNVDLTTCHVRDVLPPELAEHHLRMLQTTLDTGTLQVFEQTLAVGDRIQYEEIRMVPYGEDVVMLIIRDISDRKAVELALKASEAEHRAIISALPDLMFRVSGEGYWLGYVQTNAVIDYLSQNDDPQGRHIADHMPPEIAQQQLQKIQQALTTGTLQVFEQTLEWPDRTQYEEVRIVPQGANEVMFIVRDITNRKTAELALKSSEAENKAILAAIPDLMFRLRRDGTYLAYFKNPHSPDLLEKSENPVGHNIAEYAGQNEFYKTHIEEQMQAVHQVLKTGEMMVYEQAIPLAESIQYEEVRIVPSGEDEVLIIIQNIADRKAAELALQQSEAQKRAILTAIPDLMFHMRADGLILDYLGGTNFHDLLDSTESPVGHNLMEYATTEALATHLQTKLNAMQQALATGEMQLYEQEAVIGDVRQYEEVRVVPINPQEVLVMIRDISDRKRIEAELRAANERLAKLSMTDSLTTLANRRSLDEHLKREWTRAIREQEPISFLLFDLDYFKRFNDTYGHQLGDNCLFRVAQATAEIVNRSSDLVARYGGEEFAVVLSNTDLKGAFLLAQRIRENILALKIPHESSGINAFVTTSIGVSSIVPPPDSSPNVLIRQADQALYSAKQAGRNNCQCFISRPPESDTR